LPIQGADAATFTYINFNRKKPQKWAKDKYQIYLYLQPIDIDRSTAKVFNENIAVDKNIIYYAPGTKIVYTIPKTAPLKIINEHYFQMGKEIYYLRFKDKKVLSFPVIKSFNVIDYRTIIANEKTIFEGEIK